MLWSFCYTLSIFTGTSQNSSFYDPELSAHHYPFYSLVFEGHKLKDSGVPANAGLLKYWF